MITEEQLKQQIAAHLDVQNLHDLSAIMNIPEGRRFFNWLIMQCGQNSTSFTRDSRTDFNEGMRNVALLLEGCMKAMGLHGVDLMHKAEREYIMLQEDIKRNIQEQQENRR